MIDITKKYRTASGLEVKNLTYAPYSSNGHLVTYPVKGDIIHSEGDIEFCIWSKDGIADAVFSNNEHLNLEMVVEN